MIGILLAAGHSRRFGTSDKLLHPLPDGCAIAVSAGRNLMQALPLSIAVVRPENQPLAVLLQNVGLQVCFCSDEDQAMADSLTAAIRYAAKFSAPSNGYIIALADMPYISPETISAVASKLTAGAAIVVPTYHGQRGHPVGFSAKFRKQLEALQGDEGARSILKQHADEVHTLICDDAGIIADIDTPADVKT